MITWKQTTAVAFACAHVTALCVYLYNKRRSSNTPRLYTPGPLNTTYSVKAAMLEDVGSRENRMIKIIQSIRDRLVRLSGTAKPHEFTCVLMQGSGTFAIESVLSSVVPPLDDGGKLLVLSNGRYGERMTSIARCHGIAVQEVRVADDQAVDVNQLRAILQKSKYSHVAVVHHETTAGVLNPIGQIAKVCREFDVDIIVDSMSAFGAYDVSDCMDNIDYLVSSANKNIQGVPGFAYAICKRAKLVSSGVYARTVTLNLLAQLQGFEKTGQFRFTPPTHAMLAFSQALDELEAEGGVRARLRRYEHNTETLLRCMARIGIEHYVKDDSIRGSVITTFLYPESPNFEFADFCKRLEERNLMIYPGKLAGTGCFRVGTIGDLHEADIRLLVKNIAVVLGAMGVKLSPK